MYKQYIWDHSCLFVCLDLNERNSQNVLKMQRRDSYRSVMCQSSSFILKLKEASWSTHNFCEHFILGNNLNY